MNNAHNPIARLVTSIQQKWLEEVSPSPDLKLIRWLIQPNHARLYEGFLRLEATSSGSLPEVVVTLLSEFKSINGHSETLIRDWIENFEKDSKTQAAINNEALKFTWDVEYFKNKNEEVNSDKDLLLLEMLKSFQTALPDSSSPLVMALYPYAVHDLKAYDRWLDKLLSLGLPDLVRIMIFDYAEERYFEKVIRDHPTDSKSLFVPIDLKGAIHKIASAGDPNDPEVQFRKCMIEMSKSVASKNLKRLHQWGKKGILVTQKTGSKSAFATAHTIYAGNLFTFKEYDDIENLLIQATSIAKQGISLGEETAKPILIQVYGFLASCKQLNKDKEKAVQLFDKQADLAIEYDFGPQALSAWWLSYMISRKRDKSKYEATVFQAYAHGKNMDHELLKASCFSMIAADYYNILDRKGQTEDIYKVDQLMKEINGENWKKEVELHRKEMEKKSLSILNWF